MMLWHNFIHPWMLDEAFISFRYAENWANGLGPVYNVGEKVEGYTTFLWVAILALGNKVGFETIALAKIVSYHTAFFTLGILIFLNKIILKIKKEVGVIAALVTGTSGIFLPWPVSGMETSLFTLLLLLSVVSYLFSINQEINRKNLLITSLSLTLLTLTRPEGVLITGILFIHYVLKYRNDWTWLILPFVTIYGGYFAWRAMYYQSFLPNTFYAKSGNMLFQIFRGIRYTNRFVLASACILVPALLWIMDRSCHRAKHLRIPLLGAIVLVYVSYIILVGGDIMPAFRFFVPILPIISLLAASAFVYIFKDTRIVILATVIMVSYNFFQIASHHELNAIYFEDNVVKEGKIVGTWLKENFPADTVIATNTAG